MIKQITRYSDHFICAPDKVYNGFTFKLPFWQRERTLQFNLQNGKSNISTHCKKDWSPWIKISPKRDAWKYWNSCRNTLLAQRRIAGRQQLQSKQRDPCLLVHPVLINPQPRLKRQKTQRTPQRAKASPCDFKEFALQQDTGLTISLHQSTSLKIKI